MPSTNYDMLVDLITDRAFPMLSQYIVEGLGHQRLQASALPPGQRVHCKGHFGAEEAGDLFEALAARRGGRLRGSDLGRLRCRRDTAQIGEAGFAAHAAAFFADLRGTGRPTCRHVHV